MYLARSGDSHCADALKSFDAAIDNAILEIAGHHPEQQYPINQKRRQLAATLRSLPIHLGGFGVHRLSWIFGQKGVLKSRAALWRFVDDHYSDTLADVARNNVQPVRIGVGDPMDFIVNGPTTQDYTDDNIDWEEIESTILMQFEQVAQKTLEHVNRTIGTAQACRLRSSQFDGSGRFLTAFDNMNQLPELKLTQEEYRIAFRMRLLLGPFDDLPPANKPTGMCACGKQPLASSTEPFHSLDCGQDAFYTQRHNAGIKVLHRFLKSKLFPDTQFVFEPSVHSSFTGLPVLDMRADLSITEPLLGRHHVLDLVCGNPSIATYRAEISRRRENVVTTVHRPTDDLEQRKHVQYAATREASQHEMVAFAAESTGRLGTEAHQFITNMLAGLGDRRQNNDDENVTSCPALSVLQGQLGTAFIKVDAQMIIHRARLALNGGRHPTLVT